MFNPPMILVTIPRQCFFCGPFLLVMFHVCLCYAVLSVLCSLVVTCLDRADLLCIVFSCDFVTFPICVLVYIRSYDEAATVKDVKALK